MNSVFFLRLPTVFFRICAPVHQLQFFRFLKDYWMNDCHHNLPTGCHLSWRYIYGMTVGKYLCNMYVIVHIHMFIHTVYWKLSNRITKDITIYIYTRIIFKRDMPSGIWHRTLSISTRTIIYNLHIIIYQLLLLYLHIIYYLYLSDSIIWIISTHT